MAWPLPRLGHWHEPNFSEGRNVYWRRLLMYKDRQRNATIKWLACPSCWVLLLLIIFSTIWIIKPLGEFSTNDSAAFVLLVYKILGLNQTNLIDLASGESIWHPLLYPIILTLTGKLFGVEVLWMRLVALICLLIDIYLIWKITALMVDTEKKHRILSLLAICIFVCIPYTLDGGVHIDIDNSILPPILLLFIYLFACFQAKKDGFAGYNLILLSLVLALAFWAKLTTPLAIPLAIGIFYLVKRDLVKAFLYSSGLFITGSVLFLITWYAFCAAFELPFFSVIQRTFGAFFAKINNSMTTDPFSYLRYLGITIYWFNPLIVISWLTITALSFRDIIIKRVINDTYLFLLILSVIIGFMYLFIGRLTFGVPKYHYPLCSMIALILAYRLYPWFADLSSKQIGMMTFFSLLFGALYFLLEDPIYLLNYVLKMQALKGLSFRPIMMKLFWLSLAYLLPAMGVLWLILRSKKKAACQLLFVLIMAQTIGFNFHQALADYQVVYGYGYKGANLVYERLPPTGSLYFAECAVISPRGSLAHYQLNAIDNSLSMEQWKKYIAEKKPDALIYGPALNTIEQMNRLFLNPEFEVFMNSDYDLVYRGDYYLYRKK